MTTVGDTQRPPFEVEAALRSWFVEGPPAATDVTIENLALPRAGRSASTLLFDASWSDATSTWHRDRLVLRKQSSTTRLFLGSDIEFEWSVMESLAAASAVPVPHLYWKERNPDWLDAPFLVMRWVPGEVPNGSKEGFQADLSPDGRRVLYQRALGAVATIHLTAWRSIPCLDRAEFGPPGLGQLLSMVEHWYDWSRQGVRFDDVEIALRFLRERCPDDLPTSVFWGDCRLGNLLVDRDSLEIRAVVDWEAAGLGVAEADLAWWLLFDRIFLLEHDHPFRDGMLDHDATVAAYEGLIGRPMRHLPYFDVLATVRHVISEIRRMVIRAGSAGAPPAPALVRGLERLRGDLQRAR